MREYAIRPLEAATWNAFADLAERHNGVWGGAGAPDFRSGVLTWPKTPRAAAAPTRSVSFAKATLTQRWSSTARWRWAGANKALRTSFRTSITGKSTTRRASRRLTTASRASSSTGTTGAKACQRWRIVVLRT